MGASDSNPQQPNDSSANNGAPIPINPNNQSRHLHSATKPNKNYDMPITPVTKIAQQILPSNTTVKGDAKVIFAQCVSKYISYVTAKAYERCESECRKTLKAEDLLWAMENLGLDDYVGPLGVYLDRYRCIEGNLSMHSGVSTPISVGQAIVPILDSGLVPNLGPIYRPRPILGSGLVIYGPKPRPIYGPAPRPGLRTLPAPEPSTVGMHQSTLRPPSLPSTRIGFSMDSNATLGMVDPMTGINEFLRDGSSAGSSDNNIADFDPSVFLNINLDNV